MSRNGDIRYMIYPDLKIVPFAFNNNSDFQRQCENVGNSFKTFDDAKIKADEIRKILKPLSALTERNGK